MHIEGRTVVLLSLSWGLAGFSMLALCWLNVQFLLKEQSGACNYRSGLGKRPLLGKHPCNSFGCSNGKRPLPGKRPGNVNQDCSDDEADENTYEDDDIDDLDPFSDSDE